MSYKRETIVTVHCDKCGKRIDKEERYFEINVDCREPIFGFVRKADLKHTDFCAKCMARIFKAIEEVDE